VLGLSKLNGLGLSESKMDLNKLGYSVLILNNGGLDLSNHDDCGLGLNEDKEATTMDIAE
jgi:hypothetical protein